MRKPLLQSAVVLLVIGILTILLVTHALKMTVTVGTFLVAGLALYMAKDNVVLMIHHRLPRRGWYALAYGSISGLLWTIGVVVIAPAPTILLDWKSGIYTLFMIGAITGILGIAYDYHLSGQEDTDPRLPERGTKARRKSDDGESE